MARVAALIDGMDNAALSAAADQLTALAERRHFESAARLRDRTATAVEILWRGQRLRALATLPELIAAAPDGEGGYHLAVVRHGQLAAAGSARRGVPPMRWSTRLWLGRKRSVPTAAPWAERSVEESA